VGAKHKGCGGPNRPLAPGKGSRPTPYEKFAVIVPGALMMAVVPLAVVDPIVAVPVVWVQSVKADPVTFSARIGHSDPTQYQVDPEGLT
jgi:hypothetical protein